MAIQPTTDIDVLPHSVRELESRSLIEEAIAAYRGGALRSAIVSTWIAVAYDIIAKAQELADKGEKEPRKFIKELDTAINNDNKIDLQKIESGLLKMANSRLQLLATHEYKALVRLYEDRHLCAHPAFVDKDKLYQPSPELVRTHIVHALQYLLLQAPLQGKSAIDRFDADLQGNAFPETAEKIGTFMRARYLDQGNDVLVKNLIKTIISAPFGAERAKYAARARILALTLREISKAKMAIYDDVMSSHVARKFGEISDDALLFICPYLKNDPRIWDWLGEPERIRVRRHLENADVEALKTHAAFDALAISPLSEILLKRFKGFDASTKVNIIVSHPQKKFVSPAIDIYARAENYLHAEELGRSLILMHAQHFTADDVQKMLKAASDNDHIWDAAGTPDILEEFFKQTESLLPGTLDHWQKFLDHWQEFVDKMKKHRDSISIFDKYARLRTKIAAARKAEAG